jgi:GWxTD domain-containing protein
MAERRRSLITNEERAAFYNLASGEERQAFVELFWDRRDATPKTLNNEYKDTHYERMLYANHHFRVGSTLVWRAPRGRIYVIYDPPDEIEDIENKVGIPERGAVVPLEPPCDNISRQGGCYEVWRYHNIAGVNHPVTINFADVCEMGN